MANETNKTIELVELKPEPNKSNVRTVNGVQFYRDWDNDGTITMVNPKTVKIYQELKYGKDNSSFTPDGMFFAFSNEQFDEGLAKLKEKGITDKIYNYGAGVFATEKAMQEFEDFHNNKEKLIREKCIPQEVYFYEWNNFECCINWDGDVEPFQIVKRIFGEEEANKIVRFNAY